MPLKRWDGDPIGVLEVMNKRDGHLDQDDVAILTVISALTAISIEQAWLFQEAKLAEVRRYRSRYQESPHASFFWGLSLEG